ncbi:hypothetical protein [Sphingobacterium bovistauri]|uniref:Uncharacterized protein n=1 Tax=Sphingobacterium bovistauri TaxID=2781959 RepID=A0ABS7Z5P0_9SPHI|nr:hypothetical protein [Sphingobacterium bovistauri]MCA5004064.1 hypothetical protein [Sphingobacterium bovistauri]
MLDLLERFQSLATAGEKSSGKRFDFFVKPFPLGKSFMIIDSIQQQSVSVKVDTINSLTIIQENIINEYYTTFLSSRDKSLALGIGSERDRLRYFRNLKEKIVSIKNKDNCLNTRGDISN